MRIPQQLFLGVFVLIAFAFATADTAQAVNLYASSAQGSAGELYIIDPATGATITDIGPLNDSSAQNYGMTGLAFDPVSGVLYGSSANQPASTAGKLVTINPATGLVTPIGSFNPPAGGTMADLAFDPTTHVLYGIPSNGGASLFTINTSTGQSTLVGSSGLTATNGGGLAVDSTGVIYGSPLVPIDTFGTYDKTTGAYTNIANPSPPNGRGFGALSFNGSVLYAMEAGTASHLVTIDTTTGAVVDLGATTAQFLDGLAFSPAATVLAGDYNNNGTVDAADYPLWRKNNGTSNSLGPNDPIGVPITSAQYTQWRANFGKPSGSGVSVGSVPEPATLLLLVVGMMGLLGYRRSAR